MAEPIVNRRELLKTAAMGAGMTVSAASVPGCVANENVDQNVCQAVDHVIHHPSTVQGVMQGFPPPKEQIVTVSNHMKSQPKARWALRHANELFPTHVIGRGTGPICALSVNSKPISEIPVPNGAGGQMTVKEWLQQSYTDGFIVLHRGEIAAEEYFNGMREDTRHILYSMTKSVSMGVVANLIEQSKLSRSGRITEYVPEVKGSGYDGATIRHCLDMRSGVGWDYESDAEANTWSRFERALGLARKRAGEREDEGIYQALMTYEDFSKERARPHGGYFYYKESDTCVLGWACEKVSNSRFSDLITDLIWSRLGAEHDANIVCDATGATAASDAMSATLRDMARWGHMHLNDGRFNGRQIVPRWLIHDIRTNYDPEAITEESFIGPRHGLRPNTAYRNQFWIGIDPDGDSFAAAGHLGQKCVVFPEQETVFVKFSTYDPTESMPEHVRLGNIDADAFQTIAEALDRLC